MIVIGIFVLLLAMIAAHRAEGCALHKLEISHKSQELSYLRPEAFPQQRMQLIAEIKSLQDTLPSYCID
jgi:hypothetical protein